jgi:AcrR family transcriptional regulator
MTQEERSERSRTAILDAALEMFSHQGYRATSIRDIAGKAGVSTGSVYHHFRDKEALFSTLLQTFWAASEKPEFPLNRVLEAGAFPDRLEQIGVAAREIVSGWRSYVALIYVDVVEFEGLHIRKFYADVVNRCERFLSEHRDTQPIAERLRPSIPPATAMVMTMRVFLYYFVVELLFGVPNHYGMTSDQANAIIADVLKHGMLRREA